MCSKANAQQAPVKWPISRDIGKTKLSQTEPFFHSSLFILMKQWTKDGKKKQKENKKGIKNEW